MKNVYLDLNAPVNAVFFAKFSPSVAPPESVDAKSFTLLYLLKGELDVRLGDKIFHIWSGGMLLIPPELPLIPLVSRGAEFYQIRFHASPVIPAEDAETVTECRLAGAEFAYRFSADGGSVIHIADAPLEPEDSDAALRLLFRMEALQIGAFPSRKPMFDALLRELLVLMSDNDRTMPKYPALLRDILLFIQSHYAEDISLDSIAARFFISRSYTARLFRKYLHTTCIDYINDLRITAASDYLSDSKYKINEIASLVGIRNPYYFSVLFRKKKFMTPTEYRKLFHG